MVEAGEVIPRPDLSAFGDTQGEPRAVYEWRKYMVSLTTIPIYEASSGNLKEDSMKIFTSKKSGKRYMKGLIPAFTLNADGSKGLMGRKCTPDYKIIVVVRQARKMIGKVKFKEWRAKHKAALKQISEYKKSLAEHKKAKKLKLSILPVVLPYPMAAMDECKTDALCIMWIGISTDEADRMKDSQEPWIKTRWPLIEKNMSRQDCLDWVKKNGHPEPPRSACIFCPFHSDDEWIRIKKETPEEFQEVVQYERDLQAAQRNQEQLRGVPFLHDTCVPIDQVKFIPTEKGRKQISLFSNECNGLCGV